MHIRQRMIFAALFVSALVLAACGGKQSRHVELQANWNVLYDAVPADASYSVGHVLEEGEQLPTLLHRGIGILFENNFAAILDVFKQNTLLQTGEVTAFSRADAQWLITEVSDMPHAIESLADHFQNLAEVYGESFALEQERIGERVVLQVTDGTRSTDAVYVEVTGVGNYIIARASSSPDKERAHHDMQALSKGWPKVGRYAATDEGMAQRARADDQALSTWASVNVKALNEQIQADYSRDGLAGLADMFTPDEAANSESCSALNARIETLIPSIHVVSFTGADDRRQTEAFMRLSSEGVANGRKVMRGAPSLEHFGRNALLSIGVSFDFGEFFESRKALPAHADCGGFAGLVGLLSEISNEFSNHIKFNARTVTGTGVFILEDLNLEGFIPTANLGVFIESPNAEALFQRIVRAISKHGNAQVLATATAPTIEVSMTGAPVRVRIEQAEDRVIVTTSGLSEGLVSRLLTVAPHNDADVPFELEINGDQLRKVREEAVQYVEDMQMEDARVDSLLQVMENRVNGIHARVLFDADGLRLIVKQQD